MRVRFAPSPTGHLHVGSVRTALFNWLLARHAGGVFILRVEDTDRGRSKADYLNALLEDLQWLGLVWDEGPFFQSQRLEFYREKAGELQRNGSAYRCWCPARPAEQAAREKSAGCAGDCRGLPAAEHARRQSQGRSFVVRFASPKEQKITVDDAVRGKVDFSGEVLEDFIILKPDGFPLYNFACVIDDHLMEITHVLRGEEHLPNTPRQLLLYQAFGWNPPVFGHLPIILDEQRKKLSKREGAAFLREFRDGGFLPEALMNFLALLGWAPKENLEILRLSEIIARFTLEGIGKSPAVFDLKKLEWMNGQYIKKLSGEELLRRLEPFLIKRGYAGLDKEWMKRFAGLFQDRARTLSALAAEADCFLAGGVENNPADAGQIFSSQSLKEVEDFIPVLSGIEFAPENLEPALRDFAEKRKIRAADLIHPLRLLLTGKTVSPGIFEVMALLGKEKTLARLKKRFEKVS